MSSKTGFLLLLSVATAAAQTRVEDTDPAVIRNGTWDTVNDPAASGGTYISSSTAGSTLTLRFTGDTIRILRRVHNNGGQAGVTIDGRPWGNLRFDFGEARVSVPVVIEKLGPGAHELVMTVSGSRPIFTQQGPVSVSFDAFETPVAFTPGPEQLAALARLNQLRALSGLAPMLLSIPLSLAAQSHADYMTQNNTPGAEEQVGGVGFTGSFAINRLNYAGYPAPAAEFTALLADPVAALDFWLGNLEARVRMFSGPPTEMGYGISRLTGRRADTILMDQPFSAPAQRVIATYPADRQTDVPVSYSGDSRDVGAPEPLGFPVSIHIQPGGARGDTRSAVTATLTGPNNVAIALRVLTQAEYPQIRDSNTVVMVPLAPLTPGTTYTARIVGADSFLVPYERTWTFTTASNAAVVNPQVIEATATSVTIQWNTLGTIRNTNLQYGPSAAYGLVAPAAFNNDPARPNQWATRILELAPSTTYNYRINASDATGNNASSLNLTFTTPSVAQPRLYPSTLALGNSRVTLQGAAFSLAPGTGTALVMTDLNGGELIMGDVVTLQAPGSRFVTVGAGDAVLAGPTVAGPAERFVVEFLAGIRFRAASGRFVSAQADGTLVANALQAGARETFLLNSVGPPVTLVSTAVFVRSDTTTRGNWKGAYGVEGHQVQGETAAYPAYVAATPSGHTAFTWAASTSDPRALSKPASPFDRNASCWYAGATFNVELNFSDAQARQVAVYMLDFDGVGRSQRVDVLDPGGAVLDTRNVTGFQNGQYLVWNLTGRVTLRFTNTGPGNAVMSGLFFGKGGAATFLNRDADTSGRWKGAYGGDGFEVLGDSARLPDYASVTAAGAQALVWPPAANDDRGLQRANAPGNVAAAWSSPGILTLDVAMQDAQPHRVSLYMVDIDVQTRRQKVEVLDLAGQVLDARDLNDLAAGVYLSWTINGRVQIRVTNSNPATNAVVSGLFFGPAGPAAGPGLSPTPAGTWQPIDGSLTRIAAASDSTFAGANATNNLFWRTSAGWVGLPGGASLVAVSSASRLFASNGIDLYTGDGIGWTQLAIPPGVTFTWLAAAADGTVMAADTERRIHRRDAAAGTWSVIAGATASRVAVRNFSEFYYVQPDGVVQKNWGGTVNALPGQLADIAVSAAGEIWGVNAAQNVYRFNGSDWNLLAGMFVQVAVGNSNTIYGLDAQSRIFRWQ